MRALELYIHIPFCVRKCKYCDFLSGPVNGGAEQGILCERAFAGIICSYTRTWRRLAVLSASFLGGGNAVHAGQQNRRRSIFAAVNVIHLQSQKTQRSQPRLNPGTVDREEAFRAYQKCGINRLSIGLQSAEDRELRMLGGVFLHIHMRNFLHTYQAGKSR